MTTPNIDPHQTRSGRNMPVPQSLRCTRKGKPLPAAQRESRKKSPPAQRAGARRRSPRSGSAAAGAHIARNAGRCAPICPLRRAVTKVHDIRQGRPPPHGQGEYGGRRGCRGACPSHPLPLAGRRPRPDAGPKPQASDRKEKEKRKKKNAPLGAFCGWYQPLGGMLMGNPGCTGGLPGRPGCPGAP